MNLKKKGMTYSLRLSYKEIVQLLPLEMALAREDLAGRFDFCAYLINNDTGVLSAEDESGPAGKIRWVFRPEARRWERVYDSV